MSALATAACAGNNVHYPFKPQLMHFKNTTEKRTSLHRFIIMKMNHVFLASLVTAFAAVNVVAADLPQSLLDCSRHADDAQRLACYDEQVAALADGKNAANETGETERAADVTPAAPGSESANSVEQFGMTERLARELGVAEDHQVPTSITATITTLHEKPRGRRVVHLDNGQVWEEKSRTPHLKLEVGEQVTIEAGALGSYNLKSENSNRLTKVQRVK